MPVKFMRFHHPPEKKAIEIDTNYTWHGLLTGEATKVSPSLETLNLPSIAPLGCFHDAPLRGDLLNIVKQSLIEVELSEKERADCFDSSVHLIWVAEVIHMAGYYIYCRWLGAPLSDTFWVHGGSRQVHPCGFACADARVNEGYLLYPPRQYLSLRNEAAWADYILNRVYRRLTLPESFEESRVQIHKSKYRINDRVEIVHDEESTCVIPAVVTATRGRRIRFRVSKSDVDKEDFYDKDLWRDQADDFVYYVGFAAENGFDIKCNNKYREHTSNIVKALNTGTKPPFSSHDVTREKLSEWRRGQGKHKEPTPNLWEKGMILEIMDRLDTTLYGLKPARVLAVFKHGYLRVGPEGSDIEEDSFAVHMSSPMLFPYGYAEKHGIKLLTPKNDDEFNWKTFMKKTGFKPAPESLFHDYDKGNIPFRVGMKMEAVDQVEKLICPVTIDSIKGRMLHIKFDGWDQSYDQLYDFRSPDLLPVGWCEMYGYALQAPQQTIVPDQGSEALEEPPSKKSKK